MQMTKRVLGAALLLAVAATGPAAAADRDDGEARFSITGEARVRAELVANVLDAQDHGVPALDDEFSWFPYRARIGARGLFTRNVVGYIEVQNFGFFGNDTPAESFSDPIGQGFKNSIDSSEVQLYQAYVELGKLWGSSWGVSIGRREHTFANELHMGDADFYNGQTFDGIRATRDGEKWDLDVFMYQVTENDLTSAVFGVPAIGAGDNDVTFSGAHATIDLGRDGHSITPYLLFFRDGDFEVAGGKIYTLGAQYGKEAGDKGFDWNAEVAVQTGEFAPNGADLDMRGNIVEGWFGYNWGGGDANNRAHIGVLRASGDDDPADNDAEAFFPLFPDNHANNRLGDLDLFGGPTVVGLLTLDPATGAIGITNVTDISLGYSRSWRDGKHDILASLHLLSLTEQPAALIDDEIGEEVDVVYDYRYTKVVSFQAGIANLVAGDALDSAIGTNADDIMRAWGQVRLAW